MLPRARYSGAMDRLSLALAGAAAPIPRRAPRAEVLLVLGGGGVLGSAVLTAALACGRFARVQAWVARELPSTLRDFEAVPALDGPLRADTAILVFERARRSNGRDDAFMQPQPDQLVALATRLRAGGVRRLLVVVPHAPALLPEALKHGLATLDEGRVAALGFEQLLFLRAAQSGGTAAAGGWTRRFAAVWLAQMSWMVPQREQPLRTRRLAELLVELGWRLAEAAPATRVLPPELLWQAAQGDAAGALLAAWLAGEPLPAPQVAAQRW